MSDIGPIFWKSEDLEACPGLTHAVTMRHGGVSPAPFDSLNLGAHLGDEEANVRENLVRMHCALKLDIAATVDAKQAQAGVVARIEYAQRGTRVAGVDGLITNVPGIPLMLRFADCVPILILDSSHGAIGIAHAGWRGTVAKVVTNAVRAMEEAYGSRPADLIACIGPSIGPCCYEIGRDVQSRVDEAFPESDGLVVRHDGAIHLDLWEANARQLRELGVGRVRVAGVCTADNPEDFYSWRRERGRTGRFAAIMALNG